MNDYAWWDFLAEVFMLRFHSNSCHYGAALTPQWGFLCECTEGDIQATFSLRELGFQHVRWMDIRPPTSGSCSSFFIPSPLCSSATTPRSRFKVRFLVTSGNPGFCLAFRQQST